MPKLHGACCCVSGDEPPPCGQCSPSFGVSHVRNISACCMRTEMVETYDTDENPTGNFAEVNVLSFSLLCSITGPAGLYGGSSYPDPYPNTECGQLPGHAFVASPSLTKVLSVQGTDIITGYPSSNTPVTGGGTYGDYDGTVNYGVAYSLLPIARERNKATVSLYCPLETYVTPPCDYCSCGCTCDGDSIGIGGQCGCVGDICSPDDYPPIPHPCGQCFPAERCGGEPGGANGGSPAGRFGFTAGGGGGANPGGCNGTASLGLMMSGSLGGAYFNVNIGVRGGPGSGDANEDANGTFSCPHQGSYLTGFVEIDGWECKFTDGQPYADDAYSHVFRPVADFYDCFPNATQACETCDCGFCRPSMTMTPQPGSCITTEGTATCNFTVT